MDFGGVVFFGFLAAIIIVPQVLRHNERGRLHETMRRAFETGQPVPPEFIEALRARRRPYSDYYAPMTPEMYAAAQGQPASTFTATPPSPGETTPPPPPPPRPAQPIYFAPPRPQPERDLRRGLVWLAIGLGLVAAGGAFYAGLYYVGGAPQTFASFAAFGAIPVFVGLTYLGLWFVARKTKV